MVTDVKYYSMEVRLEQHVDRYRAIVSFSGSHEMRADAQDGDADTAILRATFKALRLYRAKAQQTTLGLKPHVRTIATEEQAVADVHREQAVERANAMAESLEPDHCRHTKKGQGECTTCRLERVRGLQGAA